MTFQRNLLSPISSLPMDCPARRAGQAMIEFVIALLAVVIVIAGFFPNAIIALPVAIVLMILVLVILRMLIGGKIEN